MWFEMPPLHVCKRQAAAEVIKLLTVYAGELFLDVGKELLFPISWSSVTLTFFFCFLSCFSLSRPPTSFGSFSQNSYPRPLVYPCPRSSPMTELTGSDRILFVRTLHSGRSTKTPQTSYRPFYRSVSLSVWFSLCVFSLLIPIFSLGNIWDKCICTLENKMNS